MGRCKGGGRRKEGRKKETERKEGSKKGRKEERKKGSASSSEALCYCHLCLLLYLWGHHLALFVPRCFFQYNFLNSPPGGAARPTKRSQPHIRACQSGPCTGRVYICAGKGSRDSDVCVHMLLLLPDEGHFPEKAMTSPAVFCFSLPDSHLGGILF